MKKIFLATALVSSMLSFAKFDVKPYVEAKGYFPPASGILQINTDVRYPFIDTDKVQVSLGAGAGLGMYFNKGTFGSIGVNAVLDTEYKLSPYTSVYVDIKPMVGALLLGEKGVPFLAGVEIEPGIRYSNFDLGVKLGYIHSTTEEQSNHVTIGLTAGYNFRIN